MHSLQQIKRQNLSAIIDRQLYINNKTYTVECNFLNDTINCKNELEESVFRFSLKDYASFGGSLDKYVKLRLSPVSNRLEI